MKLPRFRDLRNNSEGELSQSSYASGIHPVPRFYKYDWWVFNEDSPVEGDEFLTAKYALCTADAMALIDELREQGKPFIIYNERRARLDPPHTPWDLNGERWVDYEFAKPLNQDSDPDWRGFK